MEEYLLYSARCGEVEGIEECLGAKVPIDYQNEDVGNAALHLASANGHIPAITFLLENGASVNLQNKAKNTALHWACLCGQIEAVKILCEWHSKNPDRPESQKADANIKNEFGRVAMEEALQAGRSDIAEYLAPKTILEDDKTYSTIHDSQIYPIGEECDQYDGDEEEKKESSDCHSMQSEEARHPEDYQNSSAAERQAQASQRKQANQEAAEEQKLDQITQQLKDKLNMHEFDVKVTKTGDKDDGAQVAGQ